MRYLIKHAIGSIWLGTAAAALACSSAPAKRGQPATPVRVAPASRIDAPVTIAASGVVEPVQTVAVTAQVSGSLQEVVFKEGDYVQKGQVLFHIDPRPLAAAVDQATATLRRDEAQADAGRRDDERYKKLADMGYVSRSQSDQMHATALAQAATVEADRAALRAAQVNLGFATIRAPISGRSGSLLVRQGNNVGPGTGPLVVINQISPVLVRFPVLQQDFDPMQRALAMHPLTVIASSNDSSDVSEQGQLTFLDNAVDSLTGTVTGKANFANAGRRMWPGELVFLSVQLEVQRGVIAVPNEAVVTGQQGPYVYVVDAKNTATIRQIATGMQVGDMTVVARGLAAGERVVIDGQSRLNPGARVSLMSTETDTGAARLGVGGEAAGGGAGAAGGDVTAARPGGAGGAATDERGGQGAAAGASPNSGVPGSVSPGNGGGGARGSAGSPVMSAPPVAPAPSNGAAQSTTPVVPGSTTPTATQGTRAPTSTVAPTVNGRPPTTTTPTTTGRPPGGATTPTTTGRPPGSTPGTPIGPGRGRP